MPSCHLQVVRSPSILPSPTLSRKKHDGDATTVTKKECGWAVNIIIIRWGGGARGPRRSGGGRYVPHQCHHRCVNQNHPHQNFHAIIMIIINQRSHHCHRVMEKMLHRCWLVIPSSPNAADFLRCIIGAAGTRTLWFIDASLHLKGNIKQIDSNGHLRCRWSKCKNNTNHSQSASVTQSCKVLSL